MPSLKPREQRYAARILAEMRSGAGWATVTIGNVSNRGVMLRCEDPPERGTFVELRCRNTVIVARVVWSGRGSCGLRTQDRVDREALFGRAPGPATAATPDEPACTRRASRATVIRASHEQSRLSGQLGEWLAVTAMGAFLSVLAGQFVFDTLTGAFSQAATVLARPSTSSSD